MNLNNILQKLEKNKYQEYLPTSKSRWETLRESFRPVEIKTLLVGEAPPDGGTRFFYHDDVPQHDNLFLAVMKVLYPTEAKAYKIRRTPKAKKALLERFKADGFYLMDLYPMPLDQKPKGKGTSFFSKVFMEKLKQETLAEDCRIILLNPAKKLEQPLKDLGYKVFVVPFPLYEGKVKFIQQFGEIVKNK